EKGGDDGGLLGDREPDVQAGTPVGTDPTGGERFEQGGAACAVDALSLAQPFLDARIGPEGGDDLLQDAADSAGAEQLAAFDASGGSLQYSGPRAEIIEPYRLEIEAQRAEEVVGADEPGVLDGDAVAGT